MTESSDPGAGLDKVKLHRPVEGEIKTDTIERDENHWYVCFSVERDTVALPESSEEIGMDVGLDSFVALSNGREIDNPRHLKRGMAHVGRAQRRLSRRKRGSHRSGKAATLVAKAHGKIRNQRAAFHHDLSRWLVDQGRGRRARAGEGGSAWNQPNVRMQSGGAQDACGALA